jgi:hypothetical protein
MVCCGCISAGKNLPCWQISSARRFPCGRMALDAHLSVDGIKAALALFSDRARLFNGRTKPLLAWRRLGWCFDGIHSP